MELRNSKSRLEIALASERQALEQQRRFLSMLSHEYRTPLAVISGNLDIIDFQEASKNSGYDEELAAMHQAVYRLVEVMDISLERSRLSEPGTQGGMQRIAVAPFLSSKVDLMQEMWPFHIFNYTKTFDSQAIIGDPQSLKTALFNLLDNARKYSLPGTPIEVESHIEQDEVVITIQNQGTLFIGEKEENFFETCIRGVNGNDTSGAGVGLWLVRQIVEQYSGQVKLVGNGAYVTATLCFPFADGTGSDLNPKSL